jgi:hypothetical protein
LYRCIKKTVKSVTGRRDDGEVGTRPSCSIGGGGEGREFNGSIVDVRVVAVPCEAVIGGISRSEIKEGNIVFLFVVGIAVIIRGGPMGRGIDLGVVGRGVVSVGVGRRVGRGVIGCRSGGSSGSIIRFTGCESGGARRGGAAHIFFK